MICPGTGGVGVDRVMEGEEVGRTGLAGGGGWRLVQVEDGAQLWARMRRERR